MNASQRPLVIFHNMLASYGGGLLVPRSTPKLEDLPFPSVHTYLFSIFVYNLHIYRPYPRRLKSKFSGKYLDLRGEKLADSIEKHGHLVSLG
jgi:hypothetical protein